VTKAGINNIKDLEVRKDRLKCFFKEAIGGLDIDRTPLQPLCTGTVDKEAYSIRKIIFQSQPGIYVTSNLYIPKGLKSKSPAVLFACGHFENAKAADGRYLLAGPNTPLDAIIDQVFVHRKKEYKPMFPSDPYPRDWIYELPAGEYDNTGGETASPDKTGDTKTSTGNNSTQDKTKGNNNTEQTSTEDKNKNN
jgi:hypothetical protein